MLGLTHPTDPRWVHIALADLNGVLADHAHCEMKAASNALSLAARWPVYPRVARALVDLAEEEIRHYRAVLDWLDRRGVSLGKPEVDGYVAELRKRASKSCARGPDAQLADRLLVGALIEARSCERFRLLADALSARDQGELAVFYDDLFSAEARHYRTLVDLATWVIQDEPRVRARLADLSLLEGQLVAELGVRPTIHG